MLDEAHQKYIEAESHEQYPLKRLHSVSGFNYSQHLIFENELCRVESRSAQAIDWARQFQDLLGVALSQIALGTVYLRQEKVHESASLICEANESLREYGSFMHLPIGLLAKTLLDMNRGVYVEAYLSLREIHEIAGPSGMRLHLTDYHLEMARLILAIETDPTQYPEATPDREQRTLPTELADPDEPGILTLQDHIQAADKLIQDTGYHRRDAELAELKQEAGMSC